MEHSLYAQGWSPRPDRGDSQQGKPGHFHGWRRVAEGLWQCGCGCVTSTPLAYNTTILGDDGRQWASRWLLELDREVV